MRFMHADFGALVRMGVVFATVKGEGGRSKPSTRVFASALLCKSYWL